MADAGFGYASGAAKLIGALMIVGGLGFVASTLSQVFAPQYQSQYMLLALMPGGVLRAAPVCAALQPAQSGPATARLRQRRTLRANLRGNMRHKPGITAAIVIAIGALQGCGPSEDNKLSECLAFVAQFQSAYKADPPKSESGPSDLHNIAPAAEKQCRDGHYVEATRIINTAGMICSLNGGCSKRH